MRMTFIELTKIKGLPINLVDWMDCFVFGKVTNKAKMYIKEVNELVDEPNLSKEVKNA